MAKPPVFQALSFEAALERSRVERSVLIVDAMAAWCPPCKQMDATTWRDAAVVARLPLAIQIDVDREPEVAARLEVTAMPTLIAFRDGVEHDRLVGGRNAHDLIAWLDLVDRGERYEDALRAARNAIQTRRVAARELLAAKDFAAALPEYLWLWTEQREGTHAEIRDLVGSYEPARVAFTELRDAATPVAFEGAAEWIALNQIIGDDAATLHWYDTAELPPSREVAQLVEVAVMPLLIARGRWKDVGVALADPVATFHRLVKAKQPPREVAANLVRALYAAKRDERASDLEFEAEAIDPSKEMAAALADAKRYSQTGASNVPPI